MRKKLIAICVVLLVSFMASGAFSYQHPNNTNVQAYYKGTPATGQGGYNGWYDVIGDKLVYEVYGVDIINNVMSIFTNMPAAGDTANNVLVADLFFDLGINNNWDLAVQMKGTGIGNIYSMTGATPYLTSNDIYKGTNFVYGGAWDADQIKGPPYSPAPVPTRIGSTATLVGPPTTVNWVNLSGTGGPNSPKWRVDIPLGNLNLSGSYSFIWGSGECANDTAEGKVPLPGAVLLLSAGLVRLAAYARRREED